MKIGIFGFAKTGKTTLFNTLTGLQVGTDSFSQGKSETHVGMTKVPDPRLESLSEMFVPKKKTPAKVEYVDVSGVAKGEATEGETFLAELRNVDALLHVVRAFEDPHLLHSQGEINPKSDVETMEMELILADHTMVSRRMENLAVSLKKLSRAEDQKEWDALEKCLKTLENETPLREVTFSEEEAKQLRGFAFLSAKPLLVVLNLAEGDAHRLESAVADFGLSDFPQPHLAEVVPVSAKIEMELAHLSQEDAQAFMKELGIKEPCLNRLIQISYDFLGRISFFTVGEDECRAWTIRRNTTAHKAASAIHSDIERGFIRAETISYHHLMEAGSWQQAKQKGQLRLEGKGYVVNDGDIVHFRFNV